MAKLNLAVDPKRELDRKLMTAEQAAALVRSGDHHCARASQRHR